MRSAGCQSRNVSAQYIASGNVYQSRFRSGDPRPVPSRFFKVLDDTLLPISPDLEVARCTGDFSNSKAELLASGFPESDHDDLFGVLTAHIATAKSCTTWRKITDSKLNTGNSSIRRWARVILK
jgi:hypothetical protein